LLKARAHNEERYIARALEALRASLAEYEHEVIVVCDRCTDRTPEIGSKLGDKAVIKDGSKWSNSYAENLAIELAKAAGEYMTIVDADMWLRSNILLRCWTLSRIRAWHPSLGALSLRTTPSSTGCTPFWERTYDLFGSRRPRSGNRVFRADVLRKIGFRDIIAPHTDLDLRAREAGQ
jgi:glycosyltransferase involved in cell wall biosynthesis